MTFRLEATTRLSLWQICNRSEIRPQSQRTEGQTFFVMLGNAPKMSIAPKDLIGGKEANVP